MKLCIVTTVFPRHVGDGEGTFVWQLAQGVARLGVDVRVVAMHSPGAAVREAFEGVPITRPHYWLPPSAEQLRKEGGGLPINVRKYGLARVQLVPFALIHTLAALVQGWGCDLIHAHFTLSAAAVGIGQWLHRRPLVATVHGSDIYQVPKLPGGTWFTQRALARATRVTAVSRDLLEEAARLGVPRTRLRTISNGVDVTRFVPPPAAAREACLLFVGSLIKRKGVLYLLEALALLRQQHPHLRLIVLGEGPEADGLAQRAQELGVAEAVTFLGFQPQATVQAWMGRAQLLVLPSMEEGQGVVVLEALACGTPVVGTQVGGLAETLDATIGALVPPGDAAALAGAIHHLLADPVRWATASANARERAVTRYDQRSMARSYLHLYEEICSEHSTRIKRI
jgi:glycosyltransferase involved in cell wall biosynthesis